MFCAATGFAGTPKVGTGRFDAERLVPVEDARRIRVHFNADRSEQLPWTFVPQQKFVNVLPGETSLAFYRAKNNSAKDIIGIATYNVTPDRVRCVAVCNAHCCEFDFCWRVDCAVLFESGVFLLRGTKVIGGGRGRYAAFVLHRQGYTGRPGLQECR
jgi:hypothetical protein